MYREVKDLSLNLSAYAIPGTQYDAESVSDPKSQFITTSGELKLLFRKVSRLKLILVGINRPLVSFVTNRIISRALT